MYRFYCFDLASLDTIHTTSRHAPSVLRTLTSRHSLCRPPIASRFTHTYIQRNRNLIYFHNIVDVHRLSFSTRPNRRRHLSGNVDANYSIKNDDNNANDDEIFSKMKDLLNSAQKQGASMQNLYDEMDKLFSSLSTFHCDAVLCTVQLRLMYDDVRGALQIAEEALQRRHADTNATQQSYTEKSDRFALEHAVTLLRIELDEDTSVEHRCRKLMEAAQESANSIYLVRAAPLLSQCSGRIAQDFVRACDAVERHGVDECTHIGRLLAALTICTQIDLTALARTGAPVSALRHGASAAANRLGAAVREQVDERLLQCCDEVVAAAADIDVTPLLLAAAVLCTTAGELARAVDFYTRFIECADAYYRRHPNRLHVAHAAHAFADAAMHRAALHARLGDYSLAEHDAALILAMVSSEQHDDGDELSAAESADIPPRTLLSTLALRSHCRVKMADRLVRKEATLRSEEEQQRSGSEVADARRLLSEARNDAHHGLLLLSSFRQANGTGVFYDRRIHAELLELSVLVAERLELHAEAVERRRELDLVRAEARFGAA